MGSLYFVKKMVSRVGGGPLWGVLTKTLHAALMAPEPLLKAKGPYQELRLHPNPKPYLEVHCTYNLLSNCSYNLNISPVIAVTLDILGL